MVSGGCHMVLGRTNGLLKVSDGLGTVSDGLGNVYVYVYNQNTTNEQGGARC